MDDSPSIDHNLSDTESLKEKLNRDTAKICWSALASYNQNDSIIEVIAQLDLIDVASAFVSDDTHQVKAWLESGSLSKLTESVAKQRAAENPEVWAVVVPPWILVQRKP